MSKSLNPQARDYYKRLLLVADRYRVLTKKYLILRTIMWLVLTALIIVLVLVLKGKITILIN